MTVKVVTIGHDDEDVRIRLNKDGEPLPTKLITRIQLTLSQSSFVLDSNSNPSPISWSFNSALEEGVISFNLSNAGVVGQRQATIVLFDENNTSGQVAVEEYTNKLNFDFRLLTVKDISPGRFVQF